MDLLEDELDNDRVWIGSWHPPESDVKRYEALVIVENGGHSTEDDTRYGTVDIEVESDYRAVSKRLAFEIATILNDLPGKVVRGVLVDEVDEQAGPALATNIDASKRSYVCSYALAFRKQEFPKED